MPPKTTTYEDVASDDTEVSRTATEDETEERTATDEAQEEAPKAPAKKAVKAAKAPAKAAASATATAHAVEASVMKIDELTKAGIALAEIKKLKEAGVYTVQGVLMKTQKQFQEIKGLSAQKIPKIFAAAKQLLDQPMFLTGVEALKKRESIRRITTGCADFDKMLGGGIESRSITEAFGEFRTGKTQLAHTLAVTAQLPISQHGGGGRALYIDTEGTFRPEKIAPIARRFGLDPQKVLENIRVTSVHTYEAQFESLASIPALMVEEQFAIIIIDSIMALFRVDFKGRGELSERQQQLGQQLSMLAKLADEFNVAVYMTNQVMAQVDGAASFGADPRKPIGGNILAHASTTRLYFKKGRGENRVVKVYDSPSIPEGETQFGISDAGVTDAVE